MQTKKKSYSLLKVIVLSQIQDLLPPKPGYD